VRSTPPLVIVAVALSTGACGASINAVYEGDVRFERCMALDSRPDVKPTLRRACWREWLQFYTFGQTRDRVEFATLRDKQLSKASDFDEGAWSPFSSRAPSAVPEPTSVLAPPPMLLRADAGVGAEADASFPVAPASSVESAPAPAARCAGECQDSWNTCRRDCKSPACENGCSGNHKRCMRRCL
jgi:hypothetical protein